MGLDNICSYITYHEVLGKTGALRGMVARCLEFDLLVIEDPRITCATCKYFLDASVSLWPYDPPMDEEDE